jgi:energy-coupling factor transporter ATP-binding protein EcfA2
MKATTTALDATSFDAMISLRMTESEGAMDYGKQIFDIMAAKGIHTFYAPHQLREPGREITDMCKAVTDHVKLAILIASENYGEKTESAFSTYEELNALMDRKHRGEEILIIPFRLVTDLQQPNAVKHLQRHCDKLTYVDAASDPSAGIEDLTKKLDAVVNNEYRQVTIPRRLRVLLVGQSGDGKSTLINKFLHKKVATARKQARGTTKGVHTYIVPVGHHEWMPNDVKLVMYDTSGYGDADVKLVQLVRLIKKVIDDERIEFNMPDIKYDAVLLCMNMNAGTLPPSATVVTRTVRAAFDGQNLWENVILVGTHGDENRDAVDKVEKFDEKLDLLNDNIGATIEKKCIVDAQPINDFSKSDGFKPLQKLLEQMMIAKMPSKAVQDSVLGNVVSGSVFKGNIMGSQMKDMGYDDEEIKKATEEMINDAASALGIAVAPTETPSYGGYRPASPQSSPRSSPPSSPRIIHPSHLPYEYPGCWQ